MAIRYVQRNEAEDRIERQQMRAAKDLRSDPIKALSNAGRKPDPNAKKLLTLRLDPDIIKHFKATGEGWQTRMNDALRKAAGL